MRSVHPVAGFVVLATLSLGSCAPVRREPVPASAVERPAASPVERETIAGILRAEDRRVIDEALLAALDDPRPEVRTRGALALARIGDPSTRPRMERLLEDASPAVRVEAAFGLGLLGEGPALDPLERAAEDSNPLVRASVAEALGRIGARGAAPVLARLLDDPSPQVQAEACLAAWKLPDAGPAVAGLIERSRASDSPVRRAAAYALGRLGAGGPSSATTAPSPSTLEIEDRRRVRARLVEMVMDPEPEVRMQVARGLATPELPLESSVLFSLSADADPRVRINAIRGLSYPEAPVKPALLRALTDPNPGVLLAATEGLGRLRTPEARRTLHDGMQKAKGDWLKETLLLAVAEGAPDLLPLFVGSYASDPSPRLRETAAKVLVGRAEREALDLALVLLQDSEPRVQAAAVAAAGRHSGPLEKLLAPALASPDPVVRAAVARVTGERIARTATGDAERDQAARSIERLWLAAEADVLPEARLTCLDAAARAGREDWARTLLVQALDSGDRHTRRRGAEHLLRVFGEDRLDRVGPASDRPLEDYVKILLWAERPRAAIVTVQRASFAPGRFTLSLDARGAPMAAWNFAELAGQGFYDGLRIHRVVPNFVVQDGDPRGDGYGDPGYSIRDEFGHLRFHEGMLGMASDGKDTAGSQWFVTLSAQPHLDGRYTAFGSVVQNLSGVVQLIQPGDRVLSVRVYEGSGEEPLPPLR